MFEPIGTLPICVEVVVTATNVEWLATFTRSLVEDHVVACGHTIAPTRATYLRDGRVQDEAQARVVLHTRASLVPEIVARVDREHPDDLKGVVAVEITEGHPDYLQWIMHATADAPRAQVAAGRLHH